MAMREAVWLPALFLTVVLVAGLRLGEPVALVPPSLFALVLATMLLGVLVQGGVLHPDALMHQRREPVANLNGALVLASLFLASAQAFTLVTPDAGLFRGMVSVLLLILLMQTLAAAPSRDRLLRSLLITFGSAFLLKFIVLAGLSEPAGGRMTRALQALFDAATLGTVMQAVPPPAEGYLAFLALALLMIGLALLPGVTDRARRLSAHDGLTRTALPEPVE
ncbi:MAG: hypothetical protein Q8L86_20430 [Vicinamibacterales bacterium]|nr:hypothetical protein [Vicinamibacterales bacterium]